MTQTQSIMQSTVEELDKIVERIEELYEWAGEEGYRAIEHKLQEAAGPLMAALEAAAQYRDGVLTPRQ